MKKFSLRNWLSKLWRPARVKEYQMMQFISKVYQAENTKISQCLSLSLNTCFYRIVSFSEISLILFRSATGLMISSHSMKGRMFTQIPPILISVKISLTQTAREIIIITYHIKYEINLALQR